MSIQLPYRETEAQRRTFEILEDSKKLFEDVDVNDWDALQKRLQSIDELNLSGYGKISDLSIVGEMTGLKKLDFSYTEVEDISCAKSLTKLERIRFNATPVRGLKSLAGLEKLVTIRANQCSNLTPADIEAIFDLPAKSLKKLYLRRTSPELEPIVRRMREKYYGKVRIEYDLSTRR